MKKRIILNVVMFGLFFISFAVAESKYKVAYVEIGEYYSYTSTFQEIKKYLAGKGWGDKIEYPTDLYFSPGWEKKDLLEEQAKKLMQRQDIAVIIAAGSDATKAILKFNNQKTPIIAIALADPVKSKFVANEKDSGLDNFTTRILPERYKRMFRIFHDVVKFKKLGIMYDTNDTSKAYCNIDDALEVAKEKGFQVMEYNKISLKNLTEECITGIQNLITQGIDAFFLTPLNCMDWKQADFQKVIDLLRKNKIPTFAREGTRDVKAGALLGFTSADFVRRGEFHGEQIIKILQGEKPRNLTMIDQMIPKLSLNLLVAKEIGFEFSSEIMGASDEMFKEMVLPEERKYKVK